MAILPEAAHRVSPCVCVLIQETQIKHEGGVSPHIILVFILRCCGKL